MEQDAKSKKTRGFTFLEMLISVAIFALVATAISVIFQQSLVAYRATVDKNEAGQQARIAADWLVRDIQLAKDIVTAKANEIQLAIPDNHNITYYLDSAVPTNEKIRRQQDGAPVPGHLVAEGVSRFSLKYYDIQNIELLPDPATESGLSGSERSRIKTVEIDITTQKNAREFRLNTVARADYYPYYYWIKAYVLGGASTVEPYTVIQQTRPDGGYIFAGTTEPGDILMIKIDPLGIIQWAKTYNSGGYDKFGFLQQTQPDGGYIIGGEIRRWWPSLQWATSTLLIKTDASGTVEWAKTYPYTGASDRIYALQQTDDGGYILAGVTNLSVYGVDADCLLIKVNSTGEVTWAKTYDVWGDHDAFYSLQQTSDGYILAGTAGWGSSVGLVIKTDASGEMEWAKTYNGGCGDCLRSIRNISDGYILAGTSDIAMRLGYLLVKTDSDGNVGTYPVGHPQAGQSVPGTWAKRYSLWGWQCLQVFDDFYSLDQTDDGGYILGGREATNFSGNLNAWVIKTDASGEMEWAKSYDSSQYEDLFYSLQQDVRKGYIFAGYTQTSSEADGDDADEYEFLVAKTDDSGDVPPAPCCSVIDDITGDFGEPDVTSSIQFAVQSGIIPQTLTLGTYEYPGSGPDDPGIDNFPLTINDVAPRTDLVCPRCQP